MSSNTRLKRKLGDLGVDISSSKANESFCLIGTPLPPLEKSKDNGEFVPLWKQDVRDEKGRRRLHGAFTGGFSAGYFNTVGSKEGWTPSTFVSSRGERNKQKVARPEDFMDEEDLQELKDSRNLVDTTDEMDLMGGTKAELQQRGAEESERDSLSTTLEAAMLPGPKDSAGARILKKMGWRMGQGIGPRVTLRQRKLQDLQASSGRGVSLYDVKIAEDEAEDDKHTYAPRDTPVLVVERKDNFHGLGYRPGMRLNDGAGTKNSSGPAGPNLSAGFGLGALNDADEDDLDVYDGGVNSSRNRTAYDIADREDDDAIAIGSKGRAKKVNRPAPPTQNFRDGMPVLAGFVLSDKSVAEDRWFPLPDVPSGWKPDPNRVWGKENVSNDRPAASEPTSHSKWKSGISADQRGTMLGETPLPSAPRSVFEYLSKKDRERLQNITSGGTGAVPPSAGGSTSAPLPSINITIPRTEPHIADAALRGYQPFATDPVKQARYKAYLESQATPGSTLTLKPTADQAIDAFNKELEDYAKAAMIFKPLSGAMAGRFTSATVFEHGPKIYEGLHTPSAEELAEKEAEEQRQAEEKLTPKVHAARAGMYGPLTRESKPWQPARLLCKRFKVKDPNPPPEPQEPATEAEASVSPEWQQFHPPSGSAPSQGGSLALTSAGRQDLSNVGLGEDESQGRETLTYERPAMDVFKAIFASDDEDSDDEDAKEDGKDVDDAVPLAESPQAPIMDDKPTDIGASDVIDMGSFKPTFIPREGKSKKEKDRGKEKKEKKEKKKKEKSALVSFHVDEDGGEAFSSPPKERPKKKRQKEKKKDDDDAMWVEKPAPESVKQLSAAVPVDPSPIDVDGVVSGPPKGRKRAIDFM